jgi:hypothetical protein
MHSAAYESTGPGGTLHWHLRSDWHWTSRGLGGHFDAAPLRTGDGYRLYWMPDSGRFVDLGTFQTPGAVFAAARTYADEAASGKLAAEANGAGEGGCAHTHPAGVPSAPCPEGESDPGPVVIERVEVSKTTAVAGEDRAALRWTEVSFDKREDAAKFARLLERVNSTIVASHQGLVVTTNATGKDIDKVLKKHAWKEGHRVDPSAQRTDLAAESGSTKREPLWLHPPATYRFENEEQARRFHQAIERRYGDASFLLKGGQVMTDISDSGAGDVLEALRIKPTHVTPGSLQAALRTKRRPRPKARRAKR